MNTLLFINMHSLYSHNGSTHFLKDTPHKIEEGGSAKARGLDMSRSLIFRGSCVSILSLICFLKYEVEC